jgi:hypothetical protein
MFKTPAILLLMTIALSSCREVYYPDDIRSLERVPIIKGTIYDGLSPVVNISYSMGYYESTESPVSNATVQITDDSGNQIELFEDSSNAGSYKPASDDFKGVIGRVYTLHVFTTDGNEYKSSPVKIHDKPIIDSIYASSGELEVISYGPDGMPIKKANLKDGFYLFTDLSAETDSTVYYRFNASLTKLYSYLVPSGMTLVGHYIWQRPVMLNNFYNVDFTSLKEGHQVLPGYEIGYTEWTPLKNIPASATYPSICYVLTLNIYSISSGNYEYYHSIDQQLNSDNQMFAPVPSMIKSNIYCVNDPTKTVSGIFEASSVAVAYEALLYIKKGSFRSKILNSFPENLGSGSYTSLVGPPSFWINFNE